MPTRNKFTMIPTPNYAQILRAIGQALDRRQPGAFELITDGNDYLVRTEIETTAAEQQDLQPESLLKPKVLELRFTPTDIEELQQQGRTRRWRAGRMPRSNSLSHILRTVGGYIELKGAHLLEIGKQGRWVSLRYKTAGGDTITEKLEISSWHDIFVRLYRKRSASKS